MIKCERVRFSKKTVTTVNQINKIKDIKVASTRKVKKKNPEIVFRDGKPVAVILNIEEYQEILEQLEDIEDLKVLEEMRKKPVKFRRLEEFLKVMRIRHRREAYR